MPMADERARELLLESFKSICENRHRLGFRLLWDSRDVFRSRGFPDVEAHTDRRFEEWPWTTRPALREGSPLQMRVG